MPEPVDLMRVVDLVQAARPNTFAGLIAREELIEVVAAMVTEIGLLRDTVTARGEDLEESRAELEAVRGTEMQWGIRVHTGDEFGDRASHVLTGYTENGARYRAGAEFTHAEPVFRHLGEWQDAPDIAEATDA